MKETFAKMKTYDFWVKLASAIILLLRIVGSKFGLQVDSLLFMDIVTAIAGVLVVLGIISAPTLVTKKGGTNMENTISGVTSQNVLQTEQNIVNVETVNEGFVENSSSSEKNNVGAGLETVVVDCNEFNALENNKTETELAQPDEIIQNETSQPAATEQGEISLPSETFPSAENSVELQEKSETEAQETQTDGNAIVEKQNPETSTQVENIEKEQVCVQTTESALSSSDCKTDSKETAFNLLVSRLTNLIEKLENF